MFYEFARLVSWIPLQLLHPTKMIGLQNRPKGKAILMSNHRSNWDSVLYLSNTRRRIKILAKQEVFTGKIKSFFLKYLGAIPINREGNDLQAIKTCMKVLKEEKHLLIFPEGTRLKDETQILGEIKSGLALIAIKTKTPIVPIWIERKPRLFRMNRFYFGKPFELAEFYGVKLDEQMLEKANTVVREKMLALRDEIMKNPRAKKRILNDISRAEKRNEKKRKKKN